LRLRQKYLLIIFINKDEKRNLNFLIQGLENKDIIIRPDTTIDTANLFILDDISAIGISYPQEIIDYLERVNCPIIVYNAATLAKALAPILPVTDKIIILDGGGVITYLSLKLAGYRGEYQDILTVDRIYNNNIPFCTKKNNVDLTDTLLIDDILASGQTITTAIANANTTIDFACLITSANVRESKKQDCRSCRQKKGSTIPGVRTLYTPKFVNGMYREGRGSRPGYNPMPSILSMRYLISKAVDNNDYLEGYLSTKIGGKENAAYLLDLIKQVDREPIDLLRKNPRQFLKEYGVD